MKKNIKYYAIITIFSTMFSYVHASAGTTITRDTKIGEVFSESPQSEETRIVPANKTSSKTLIKTLLPAQQLNVLDKSEQHAFQRFLYWTKTLVEKYIHIKTELDHLRQITQNAYTPDQRKDMLLISQQSEAEKKIQLLTDALKNTEQELQTTKEALEKSLDANQKQKLGHGAERKKLLKQQNDNDAELRKTIGSLESVRAELNAVTLRNNELTEEVAALRTTNQTLENRNRELQSLGYDKSRLQGQVNILVTSSEAAMTFLAKLQKGFIKNNNMQKLNENMNKINAAVTQLKSIIEEKQNSNDSTK